MISKEEIQKLAELSRLKLSDLEVASLQKDFDSILEYVSQVQSVASDSEANLARPDLANVMRADEPRSTDDALAGKRESILAAAPKREGDYFVVRKIIERD